MTRYFMAVCVWAMTLLPIAAAAQNKVLRVAIAADNPPLAYAADGKAVGIEADFARMLQVELGAQLQLNLMPSADVVPALERGEVDIVMAGLVISPDLEKRVEFSRSYLRSGEMAIIRTDDILRFRGAAALLQDGVKVGAVTGSAGADYVKTTMNRAVPTFCLNAEECLQALLSRRVDVFVGSPANSWRLATETKYGALMSFYRPLNEEYFAWAVAKNNTQLRDRLDTALEHMKHLQMFEHILNRWIPVRVSSE
jgi:ABC-type amino acid transport substrate-binding protein